MDRFNAETTNGTNVQVWNSNNTLSQRWFFHQAANGSGSVSTPDSSPAPSNLNGTYTIVSQNDRGKAIDLDNNDPTPGTNIQLYETNGTTAQVWTFAYNAAADAYTITNPNGNRIDLANSDTTNGNNIRLWTPNDSCAELWHVQPNDDGSYTFLSACDRNHALDADNAGTANGTNIHIWDVNGTGAQKWYLLPL